jgi:hypothetical protein
MFILWSSKSDKIDKWLKADNAQYELENRKKNKQVRKPLTTNNIMIVLMVVFDGFRTFLADIIAPFFKENYPALEKYSLLTNFLVGYHHYYGGCFIIFTKVRKIESYGASKVGTVFLYILVATIGTHMNLGHTRQPHYS